jgi:hypothetical protein
MEELQNLAGKIEELKEKLTDKEYKDLLESSQKCHTEVELEKQKNKRRVFIKCEIIRPRVMVVRHDTDDGSVDISEEVKDHIYLDGGDYDKVNMNCIFKRDYKCFEVVSCNEMNCESSASLKQDNICHCTHQRLKQKGYIDEGDNDCIILFKGGYGLKSEPSDDIRRFLD